MYWLQGIAEGCDGVNFSLPSSQEIGSRVEEHCREGPSTSPRDPLPQTGATPNSTFFYEHQEINARMNTAHSWSNHPSSGIS